MSITIFQSFPFSFGEAQGISGAMDLFLLLVIKVQHGGKACRALRVSQGYGLDYLNYSMEGVENVPSDSQVFGILVCTH